MRTGDSLIRDPIAIKRESGAWLAPSNGLPGVKSPVFPAFSVRIWNVANPDCVLFFAKYANRIYKQMRDRENPGHPWLNHAPRSVLAGLC